MTTSFLFLALLYALAGCGSVPLGNICQPPCPNGLVCLNGQCTTPQDGGSFQDGGLVDPRCQNQPAGFDCGTCLKCNEQGACVDDRTQDQDCGKCMECGAGGTCVAQQAGTDVKGECLDDKYCNGLESCNGQGGCQPGSDPCNGLGCDENLDACTGCQNDSNCPPCKKCDGNHICVNQTAGEDLKHECPDGDCLTGNCNGSGACGFKSGGTQCPDTNPKNCHDAQCDDHGRCIQNYALESNTHTCRSPVNDCDQEEKCTGASPLCPADAKKPNGASCPGSDHRDCTSSCLNGVCQDNVPAADLQPCAQGGGICCTGNCAAGAACCADAHCDDQKECTIDKCNQGQCSKSNAPPNTPCNGGDGNWCNSSCDGAGTCGNTAVVCQDTGFCSGGATCNPASGCQPNSIRAPGWYCDGQAAVHCGAQGVEAERIHCAMGCNSTVATPRCYRLKPSNVPASKLCANQNDLTLSGTVTINTDTGKISGVADNTIEYSQVIQASGAKGLGIFSFRDIIVQENATVHATGERGLVLLACREVKLNGIIDISAEGDEGGAGGYGGGAGSENRGQNVSPAQAGDAYATGAGQGGWYETDNPWRESGGGGGGFGSAGGAGGKAEVPDADSRNGGSGGEVDGNAGLIPLTGGAGGGGGGGFNIGGNGGGGGGAIQISAGLKITIGSNGGINAAGSGGGLSSEGNWGAGGGGGAGGGILLETPELKVEGTLAANGGGGGGSRTQYHPWLYFCPNGTPTVGEPGPHAARRAEGGLGCTGNANEAPAGDGGKGGALSGDTAKGENGRKGRTGGGGGGGLGRIRLNSYQGTGVTLSGATSPDCGSANDYCTQGAIERN